MKYHIVTLGCPKNHVDSEGMDGVLHADGHHVSSDVAGADVIIVNTCSFIASARQETIDVLQSLSAAKRPGQRLIAAGCMAQSHGHDLEQVQGVDDILSTQQWMQIGQLVNTAPAAGVSREITLEPVAKRREAVGYADWRTTQIRRTKLTPSAYLKISDGCNLRCAFCTIPSFKGDMRSKPVGSVLAEARELAEGGVGEIILVAQHLTDYGRDLGLKDGLATLLQELCQVVPENVWIRLMYAYPHGITERLIATMATHRQILPYLDMPLQHAHPDTLKRMRRPPDTERTLRVIEQMRAALPDLTLRSGFIVGFPGETTAEFQALLEFLRTAQLDRVGAFRFSQEPGTHAATLPDQVRPQVIEKRWHELMQQQQQISKQRQQRWIGRTLDVLVEGNGQTDRGGDVSLGRSFRDAPEIDGQVFVDGKHAVGSKVRVTIDRAGDYDLWGRPQLLQA